MEFTLREWLMIIGVIVIIAVLLDGFRRVRSSKRNTLKLAIDKNLKFRESDRVDYFNGELPSGNVRVVNRSLSEDDEIDAPATPVAEDGEIIPESLFLDDHEPDGVLEAGSSEAMTAQKSEAVVNAPAVAEQPKKTSAPREVDEVLVINVVTKDDQGFNGNALARVIQACGMCHGDMDIFHRNEAEDNSGAVQFSMANLVKPGTFDMDNMDAFQTPGVSFFLSLPGPEDSMKAFEYMLETAQCVAKNLNGDLKDEQHSAMTGQTIEHSRQKIRDYERRQMSLLN